MFQFRSSTVLKELFEVTLKRPLSGSTQKTWLPTRRRRCCSFGTAGAASAQLTVRYAAAHRPAPRAASFRAYCTKTEGAVELEEQLKKDGVGSEAPDDR